MPDICKHIYYRVCNNIYGCKNSDGWQKLWILIIVMAVIIVMGDKSLNFNNTDGCNNSNAWKLND